MIVLSSFSPLLKQAVILEVAGAVVTIGLSLKPYHQESMSSKFYARIFRTKVCSNPNSKQRKAAQKTFVQKMRAINVDEILHFTREFFI